MKKLLLITLFLLSFNSFAEAPPPANAFKGTLYGYEVAVYITDVFGGLSGLRSVYKNDGEWLYLSEPSFYDDEVNTKSKADAKFALMISIINATAFDKLNDISLEPDCCTSRIQWLLENKLTDVDNELIVE